QVAVDRARAGEGPSLLEIRTYRFRGHSMSDPAKYRTKEEVDEHKKRDAVSRLEAQLLDDDGTKGKVEEVKRAVEDEIQDCLTFADESPEPGPDILAPTTYAGEFAS
ncbi:MAG: thiamine pyrophosphate-dependent enzyme, partial [Polyangiaceae bacterium]